MLSLRVVPPPTLDPLIAAYINARLHRCEIGATSAGHLTMRLQSLSASFGVRPLDTLDRHAIQLWEETAFAHLASASRAAYLSAVRVFCAWLVVEGHIVVDPTMGVAKVRRPRSVPRAQSAAAVSKLFAACRDDRDRLVIWLMVGMGLRRGEVAAVRLENYDPTRGVLVISGKGGHERALPVPTEVAAAITACHGHRMWSTGPMIRNHQTNRALDPRTITSIVATLFRSAGLKTAPYDGVSAHALRHTAASDVLDACHDLRVVQQMLGHTSLATTQIYLRRADLGQLRTAMGGRDYGQQEEPA